MIFERSRRPVTIILVVAGSLLLLFAIVAVWTHGIALNTDRYVEIADSLISDEAIVNALAASITTQLFEQVDVEAALLNRLPDRMQFLAAPLTDNLYDFAVEKARILIGSDQFHQIWVQANRTLHEQLVRFLRGETEMVKLNDGQVTLDLGQIASVLQDRLSSSGVDIFQGIQFENRETEIVVLESEQLQRLQAIVFQLDRLAVLLPVLVLLCYVSAIIISPPQSRITVLIYVGAGIVLSMVLLELGLLIIRSLYLDSMKAENLTIEAAAVLFDTVFVTLRNLALGILGLGVSVMIVGVGIRRSLGRASA